MDVVVRLQVVLLCREKGNVKRWSRL